MLTIDKFRIIPVDVFWDPKMSSEARGVYATWWGLDENERTLDNVAKLCSDNREVIIKAFRELIDAGYLKESEVME